MTRQFVLLNKYGDEIDWIDPVISFEETDTLWVVNNGNGIYAINKNNYPGCTFRFKVLDWVWEDA